MRVLSRGMLLPEGDQAHRKEDERRCDNDRPPREGPVANDADPHRIGLDGRAGRATRERRLVGLLELLIEFDEQLLGGKTVGRRNVGCTSFGRRAGCGRFGGRSFERDVDVSRQSTGRRGCGLGIARAASRSTSRPASDTTFRSLQLS